jgi:tetratricopeptide (TPR) repeat protein
VDAVRRLLAAVLLFAMPEPAAAASVDEAESAWRLGERARAGELVREYVREHPASARSERVAALLARTAEDPADAMGRWDEVLALDPGGELAAEARWEKAMHAYSAGLYVAAAQEFEEVSARFGKWIDPGRALLWQGYAQLGADRAEDALAAFREAERKAQDRFDRRSAELGVAHATFRLGNVREALRLYERFEEDHPDDGRASAAARRAVECLRLTGRNALADQKAKEIEERYPDSFEATLARADVRPSAPGVAPEEVPETVVPAPRGPFVVQVAAMTDPRNAAELRRLILAKGLGPLTIEPGEGPLGPVHRVILGPYATEAEARAAADSVATLGDLNPRVREAASP